MKKFGISLLLCLTTLTGCSSTYIALRQDESSGLIGCHPKDITIEKHDFAGQTWTATCKDTKFYCGEKDKLVNCKEAR